MQLGEIDKELEFVIRNPKKRFIPNDTVNQLHALRTEVPFLKNTKFKELCTIPWGSQIGAFRFLRMIACMPIQEFNASILKDGFNIIHAQNALGIVESQQLAVIAQQQLYNLNEIHRGLGAGSFAMERLTDQSYWIGTHKHLVGELDAGSLVMKKLTTQFY